MQFAILWWIEYLKEQHLFEVAIFCNILNVFTVYFVYWDMFPKSDFKPLRKMV